MDSPWPGFLDRLDTDPHGAWEGLYIHAWKLLKEYWPPVYAKLSREDREDLFEDTVQSLQANDFRLLRTYGNRGFPFAVWFYEVIRRRSLSKLRGRKLENIDEVPDWIPARGPASDKRACDSEALDIVYQAMDELPRKCRLLLKATVEGHKPKDLVELFGWPQDQNKRMGDKVRDCRRSLVKALSKLGYTVDGHVLTERNGERGRHG